LTENTVGRPTSYNPEMLDKMHAVFATGGSIAAVCVELDISRETLYDWTKRSSPRFNKDFSDSFKAGKLKAQVVWENIGLGQSDGSSKGNATTYNFIVKNRFKEDYADKKEIEVSGNLELTAMLGELDGSTSDLPED